MQIEHYREFIVLAEELHYRNAARRLCMTQSTLSKHISALEGHYGVRLFERDKLHVSLTSKGSILLESATTLWNEYERSMELLSQRDSSRQTLFISGTLDNPSDFSVVSLAVERFEAVNKRYAPHFLPCLSTEIDAQANLLRTREADCAVFNVNEEMLSTLDDAGDFDLVPICKMKLDAVVGKGNILAGREELGIADLDGCTLIKLVGPRLTPTWRQIEKQLVSASVSFGTKPVAASSAYDYMTLDPFDNVLIIPRTSIARQTGTARIPLHESELSLSFGAVFLKERRTQAIDDFIGILRDCFSEMLGTIPSI